LTFGRKEKKESDHSVFISERTWEEKKTGPVTALLPVAPKKREEDKVFDLVV